MQLRDIFKMYDPLKQKTIKHIMLVLVVSFTHFVCLPYSAIAQDAVSEEQASLLKRGQRMFLRCRTCHTLDRDGKHGTGPNLYGIFGSKSASKEGFTYSKALQNSNITWSEDTINNWMSKPRDFVKGTSMAFVGLKKPKDRAALIAYLKENTK